MGSQDAARARLLEGSLFGDTHVANPWQIALVANYAFSKQTDVYLTTAYAKNAGLMMESLATVYANSLLLGVRHKF